MAAQARRKLIAGNWKMNKTLPEALALVRELKGLVASLPADRVEIAVAPPFVSLQAVARELEGSSMKLAAQNCHWEASGAYTGEVSAPMLKDVGCAYV
ncbi:MAG: triose-phosphate isomerase, partial [Archangium sp.]